MNPAVYLVRLLTRKNLTQSLSWTNNKSLFDSFTIIHEHISTILCLWRKWKWVEHSDNLVFLKCIWQIRQISQILLKCLVFTPSTSNWAQNVLNVDWRHSRIKFNKNVFKGFLILTIGQICLSCKIRQISQICQLSLNFGKFNWTTFPLQGQTHSWPISRLLDPWIKIHFAIFYQKMFFLTRVKGLVWRCEIAACGEKYLTTFWLQ